METDYYKHNWGYFENDANIAQKLLHLKENAEKRNIPFSLSFAHLKKILRRKTCYYTGISLTPSGEHRRSVDRIDNNEGYTDSNTIVCSAKVNTLKDQLSLTELEHMVKQLKKKLR